MTDGFPFPSIYGPPYLTFQNPIDRWMKGCILPFPKKGDLAQQLECSPMARETWVQSKVESYQRL